MTINPRDYDLDELREMARKRGTSAGGLADELGVPDQDDADPFEDAGADASMRGDLYRELLPLEASTSDDLEKPYLETLPDTYAGELMIFEWLEFLLVHAGYRGAQDALGYYESIDWITEDVSSGLRDYLLGIEEAESADDELDVDDHMLSLVYVAKLVSME